MKRHGVAVTWRGIAVTRRVVAALAVATVLAGCSASSTGGGGYRAAFTGDEPDWDASDRITYGGGTMTIAVPANRSEATLFHGGSFHGDGTICATETLAGPTGTDPEAGLLFWATDLQNEYQIIADPWTDGDAAIFRRVGGADAYAVVPFTVQRALKTGPRLGPVRLCVEIRGIRATLTVNGALAETFLNPTPPAHWFGGVRVEAANRVPATWLVRDFTESS